MFIREYFDFLEIKEKSNRNILVYGVEVIFDRDNGRSCSQIIREQSALDIMEMYMVYLQVCLVFI
jgi:hypothetical protein